MSCLTVQKDKKRENQSNAHKTLNNKVLQKDETQTTLAIKKMRFMSCLTVPLAAFTFQIVRPKVIN